MADKGKKVFGKGGDDISSSGLRFFLESNSNQDNQGEKHNNFEDELVAEQIPVPEEKEVIKEVIYQCPVDGTAGQMVVENEMMEQETYNEMMDEQALNEIMEEELRIGDCKKKMNTVLADTSATTAMIQPSMTRMVTGMAFHKF